MKKLVLLAVATAALSLGGCATMGDYCEEHGQMCATVGSLGAALAVGCVMAAASHSGPGVHAVAPSAPIKLCTGCTT